MQNQTNPENIDRSEQSLTLTLIQGQDLPKAHCNNQKKNLGAKSPRGSH